MIRNIPQSLIDSVAKVVSEDRAKYKQERDEIEAKLQLEAMKKMKYEYVVPEDIEKEGVAHFMGAAAAAHKAGKKSFAFGGKTYPVKIKPHIAHQVNKEEVEQQDEATLSAKAARAGKDIGKPGKQFAKIAASAAEKYGSKEAGQRVAGAVLKKMRANEATDTPGNSTHQCALHVKHEQFGEGKTIYSQHAEPSEDGAIEWYDVMFEHGIEKKVLTADLEIVVSESHNNHKGKKHKEGSELEEGRGRPRKNPAPAKAKSDEDDDDYGPDTGPEPDQNIVNHLKKSVDTGGTHDVKFGDGSSHKVPSHVAHKVLGAMGKLKPADRLEIQKHIGQSHKNLMDVHRMIK